MSKSTIHVQFPIYGFFNFATELKYINFDLILKPLSSIKKSLKRKQFTHVKEFLVKIVGCYSTMDR